MGWRQVMLTSPGKVTVKQKQLVFTGDSIHKVPIEDLDCLMIENRQITISASALETLGSAGVCTFVCDKTHTPSAVVTGFNNHSRQLKILENQISMTLPQKKRLWQQIIIQKIRNQSTVLNLSSKAGDKELMLMANEVKSGDSTHVEGKAAAFYFKHLFYPDFTRGTEDVVNGMLNYGYAIIRGAVARTLTAYGFQPALGIFHHNQLNAFNLADDLIEVFRPVVDLHVAEAIKEEPEELTPIIKQGLYQLLNMDVLSGGQYHPVSYAIERTVQSLSAALSKNRNDLILCDIVPLEPHEYE